MKYKILLLGGLLLLGVGFATVSTTLLADGNVKIATNNADFDVRFTKATLDGTDVSADVISFDGKTIEYATSDLLQLNDVLKLDFEITNNSTMYDADVGVELTINETNRDYYEITKEIPTSIEGKRTGKGKIEVKLKTASTDDIQGTLRCTLKATAKERTTKAQEEIYYAYGDPSTAADRTTDYTTLGKNVFIKLDAAGKKSVCTTYTGNLECFDAGADLVEECSRVEAAFAPYGVYCQSEMGSTFCNNSELTVIIYYHSFEMSLVGANSESCRVYNNTASCN